jgi:two-component system chemotaxis response regulator CheV
MLVAEMGGLVTAITELKDGRLVMMMDVEKVLSETTRLIPTRLSTRT